MSLIAISETREPSALGPIILDVTLSETHTHSADITDHVIEQGGLVSDHRRIAFPMLSLDAICSNIPLASNAVIDDEGNVTQNPHNPRGYTWEERYAQLFELFEGDAVFTVVTAARVYESMHFSSLVVRRDQNTGEVLSFSAELRRMEFASSDTVSVAPSPKDGKKKGTPKAEKGAKSTTQADAKVQADSNTMAFDLFGTVPGAIRKVFTPATP